MTHQTAQFKARRCGFTWIEVIVVLGVLALLVVLLLPATRRGREPARRTQCKNNLKQIGLALHNYHDMYQAFPPAYTVDANGKPLHSWRTLILPFLEQRKLYEAIDLTKPWDDPANAVAYKAPLHIYGCPSHPVSTNSPTQTTYLAVVTANSVFCPNQSRTISEITDGTSNTVLVIEVPYQQSVHWMAPLDADETLILQGFGKESKQHQHAGGEHSLMADGSVRFLSQSLVANTLKALVSAAGGDTVGEY